MSLIEGKAAASVGRTRVLLAALIAGAVSVVLGAVHDTAIYPVSGHAPAEIPAPALVFEKIFEATVPGLPTGPLRVAPDGASYVVTTTSGVYLADSTGTLRPAAGIEDSSAKPQTGCSWPVGHVPRWLQHLDGVLSGPCIEGHPGIVAILGKDGTVYGRNRRHGHLLWRRMAPHRISREGASLGPYIFIVPDASRALEALRWEDGSVAGVFQLESEDASFASAPVVNGSRLAVLSVQSPRKETRLLMLQPRPEKPPARAVAPSSASQG